MPFHLLGITSWLTGILSCAAGPGTLHLNLGASRNLDRWGGNNYLWHLMLAQHGYVVVSMDNRGTPSPRGRAWRKSIYRQVGILASQDQAAAVRKILEWPYLDAERGAW